MARSNPKPQQQWILPSPSTEPSQANESVVPSDPFAKRSLPSFLGRNKEKPQQQHNSRHVRSSSAAATPTVLRHHHSDGYRHYSRQRNTSRPSPYNASSDDIIVANILKRELGHSLSDTGNSQSDAKLNYQQDETAEPVPREEDREEEKAQIHSLLEDSTDELYLEHSLKPKSKTSGEFQLPPQQPGSFRVYHSAGEDTEVVAVQKIDRNSSSSREEDYISSLLSGASSPRDIGMPGQQQIVSDEEFARQLMAETESPPAATSHDDDEALARQLMQEEEAAMQQLMESTNFDEQMARRLEERGSAELFPLEEGASADTDDDHDDEALARQLMREEEEALQQLMQSTHLDEEMARRLEAAGGSFTNITIRNASTAQEDEELARRLQEELSALPPAATPPITTASPAPPDTTSCGHAGTTTAINTKTTEDPAELRQFVERGQEETASAIRAGQSRLIQCAGCSVRLRAPIHSPSVFCPQCGVVSVPTGEEIQENESR